MNDYKQIRQRYLDGESQRHIAKTMGISRNTVAKYCEGASVPWERKTPERESSVLTDDVTSFIIACLEEDRQVTFKKQKHTAKRIYDRLVAERGFTGGESTIRRKVREIRATLPQVYIPLQFDPGSAIQVDWGEADIYLRENKIRIYLFCARLCYSCRPVVFAYRQQNTESFCDALVRTFTELNGVPQRVIFDNGKVAVKEGYGTHAKMQHDYEMLSAHYGFDAVFCNPAEGHEKGLVEGLVGWVRRNVCVPVPHVNSIQELNTLFKERCCQYENHHVRDRKAMVGQLYREELAHFMPLPNYAFEIARCMDVRVSHSSTIRYKNNIYSVPVKYAGFSVSVKAYPESIEVYYKGALISKHERLTGRNQASYHLADYLPILEKRPRAVFDAAPVKQNIPLEVLQRYRNGSYSKDNVIDMLRLYADRKADAAVNEITVKPVDLHQYDALSIGKEV